MLQPLLEKLNEMKIVLASSSKQRSALLKSLKLKFTIYPSTYKENLNPKEHTISEFVEKTAMGKLQDVYQKLNREGNVPDLIIAVDTMVAFNGRLYGKPNNKVEARQFITDLTQSGIPNQVYSGVCIWYRNNISKFTEVTTVYMSRLSDEEIKAYVESGEPMGKAGGYGIQGIASTFVERIDGDCNNVIGLPLCRLVKELKLLVNDVM